MVRRRRRPRPRDFTPITPGGNPQTGPFYIEGAEPGDTLAVHLDRLWPNRTLGFTGKLIAPCVIDPEFVSELPYDSHLDQRPSPPDERHVDFWELDLERGRARLQTPRCRSWRSARCSAASDAKHEAGDEGSAENAETGQARDSFRGVRNKWADRFRPAQAIGRYLA
jgi:hypothetical protein